jgi:predicted ATPase
VTRDFARNGAVHRFIDFKSFADAELSLFRPLTLLIGKNGSGKSNAIEGVELLAELVHGRPLYEVSDVARGGAFEVRGGLPGCVREGKEILSFEFRGSRPFAGVRQRYEYHLSLRARPEPRIASESLVMGDRTLFATEEGSDELESGVLRVRYDNFARGGNKPRVTLAADRTIFSQYESFATGEKLGGTRTTIRGLRSFLHASFVFDPIPKGMRQYDRIGNRVLARQGGNISPVLYALHKGSAADRAALARILGWIKQLPEEPYESFAFVTTELGDVMLGLREREGGPIIDARVLSDGTLRCLAVLTALETVKSGSHVVVEELDNGLHPSRTGVLIQAIWDACKRRKLRALCTTHNPATLDALTREQLDGVVVAFWDKTQAASRLVPLLSLPRADVLLERGHLGDLVTRRVLEEHLMPGMDERVREETKAWLHALP